MKNMNRKERKRQWTKFKIKVKHLKIIFEYLNSIVSNFDVKEKMSEWIEEFEENEKLRFKFSEPMILLSGKWGEKYWDNFNYQNSESYINEKLEGVEKITERAFQNLLIAFPQIIEDGLKYKNSLYQIGNSKFSGDILYKDLKSRYLNVEIKITRQSFKEFENQLLEKYMKNINMEKERLMYIAPHISKEQKKSCKRNNIETREIDINRILARKKDAIPFF